MRRLSSTKLIIAVVALATGSFACNKKKENDDAPSTSPSSDTTAAGTIVAVGGGSATPPAPASPVVPTPEPSEYQPTSAPGTLAVQLPLALTSSASGAGLQGFHLTEDDSAAAGTTKSEGFEQLRAKLSEIPPLVADLTEKLYLFDQVLAKVETTCDATVGAGWTSCPTADVTSTLTDEMVTAIIAKVGEDVLGVDAVAALKVRVAEEVSLGVLTITKLTNDPSGYTKCVALDVTDASSTKYCFNATDVQVIHRDIWGDDGSEGTTVLSYKESEGLFTMSHAETDATYTYNDRFTLKKNSEARGKHGVIFTADVDDTVKGYGSFTMAQTGLADDLGGVVETKYMFTQNAVTALELSAATTTAQSYVIAPGSATLENVGELILGYVLGDGTTGLTNYVEYYGPSPAAEGLSLWTLAYDEETGAETYADSAIVVNTLSLIPATGTFFYKEEFGANGDLTFWCAKLEENGGCIGTEGDAGEYSEDYDTFEETEGEDAFDLLSIALSYSGLNANAETLGGTELFVFEAAFDATTALPFSDEANEAMLADIYFTGDLEALSSEDMAGYETYVLAPAVNSFDDVKVYRVDPGDEDVLPHFVEVPNFLVTASEGS